MIEISKVLDWLTEKENHSVRYLSLKYLVNLPQKDPALINAREAAYAEGAIGQILAKMNPEGWWAKPGAGYGPKYKGSVWALIALAQLGARVEDDPRVNKACRYYLDHAFCPGGQVSYNGTPSGTIDCLQGNMLAALSDLGFADPRMDTAYDWLARSNLGEVDRYYAYKCGPGFACGPNGKKPCAWGGVKALLAFSKIPATQRTKAINNAIKLGIDFIFRVDPAFAAYPTRENTPPNRSWWKFGFPVFYVTDILQIVEALAALGFGQDPRLQKAIALIKSKQDAAGRWPLEYDYNGKTWFKTGEKRQPSKWVTYRALKALRAG